jgi:hypothetical protein
MYQLNGKRWPVKLGLKCFALLRRLTPQHSGDLHRRPDAAASRRNAARVERLGYGTQ